MNFDESPLGIYHDCIHHPGGHVIDYGWRKNRIVNRCRTLLAAFMLGDMQSQGIRYLSLGRGEAAWDDTPPASPVDEDIALTDSDPVNINMSDAPLEISYLDAASQPTLIPSSRLQLLLTIEAGFLPIAEGETHFPLREFGLFGRYDTEDYMIDYVRHPVINIAATDTFTRTIRLVF